MTFERFVAYKLTIVEDDGNHTRLDKSSCLLAEPKVKELKNQIQVNKADLCLASSLFTQYCRFLKVFSQILGSLYIPSLYCPLIGRRLGGTPERTPE